MRLLILAAVLSASVAAQDPSSPPEGAPLVVGVWDAPPFAVRGSDGTWDGLGVHLVRESALVMGREVAFREVAAAEGLDALADGRVDVLAAIRAAPDVERRADLTPAYYAASLGAATRPGSGLLRAVGRLFSPTFLWIALGLSILLLVVGVAIWKLEGGRVEEGFAEGRGGIWDGFWWAGVTMTTIGYGDLVPTSVGGRVLGLVWMLVSMAVTAALTASMVSALGLGSSTSNALRVPDDLRDRRVGAVAGSDAEAALRQQSLDPVPVASLSAGLRAVEADSLDVLVGSAPRLQASTGGRGLDLNVEATAVRPERWSFAVAEGSALREPLAQAVLDRIGGPDWRAAVERYVP